MKTTKRLLVLLFAVIFCFCATMVVTAEEVNVVEGSVLEFKPLRGDVNVDGFLNLKDLVRYKKYLVEYDETSIIDTEVADFNADEEYTAADLVGLQEDIINNIFG